MSSFNQDLQKKLIAFWRHEPVFDQKSYSLAETTLDFHKAVGGDFVKLTPSGTYQATALGLKDSWEGDLLGRRNITFRPIKESKDWLKLKCTSLGEQEMNCLQASELIIRNLSDETPLLATVFSPLSQAIQLAGLEYLVFCTEYAPDELSRGLELIAQRTKHLIECYKSLGIHGIYYVSQHHLKTIFPRLKLQPSINIYDQFVILSAEGLLLNIMHFHGAPLVEQLPKLPFGWRVHYEFTQGNSDLISLNSIQSESLMIGLSIDTLMQGHNDSIRQNTIDEFCTQDAFKSVGFGASCVLPLNFSLKLASAWVKTVNSYE